MKAQRARTAANKEPSAQRELLRRTDLRLSSPIVIGVSANGGLMMAKSADAVHPTDDATHGGTAVRARKGQRPLAFPRSIEAMRAAHP